MNAKRTTTTSEVSSTRHQARNALLVIALLMCAAAAVLLWRTPSSTSRSARRVSVPGVIQPTAPEPLFETIEAQAMTIDSLNRAELVDGFTRAVVADGLARAAVLEEFTRAVVFGAIARYVPPAPPKASAFPSSQLAPVNIPQQQWGSSLSPCGGDLPPCYVKARESGGNYNAQNPNSSASGAWQFLDSTWAGFGGYSRALFAPPAVQDAKARQLWANGAGCSHWSAC